MKEVFNAEGVVVQTCQGHHYVGGCVGSLAMCNRWIKPMVMQWVDAVSFIVKITGKYPQFRVRASSSKRLTGLTTRAAIP